MSEVSRTRLREIAAEVFELLGIDGPFDLISNTASLPDNRMEHRLQELLSTRQSYSTLELAMYLRSSYSRSQYLPTWQPLVNATIEQGLQRGDRVWDILYGIAPHQPDPERNTGQPLPKRQ